MASASVATALTSGLAGGMLHVATGPDHLAALAPLAIRDRGRAARAGAVWGAGHGTGVLLLGGVGVAFKEVIDIGFLTKWSEISIGLLLIVIGGWALAQGARDAARANRRRARSLGVLGAPAAATGAGESSGSEASERAALAELAEAHGGGGGSGGGGGGPRTGWAAYGVGVLHGSAGTGHLFGVLPSLALPPFLAGVFLLSYLLAAVAMMSSVGFMLGRMVRWGGARAISLLTLGSGLLAVCIGLYWVAASVSHPASEFHERTGGGGGGGGGTARDFAAASLVAAHAAG